MSGHGKPTGGKSSLPEEIATEAGLPRADGIGHSLHDIDERVGERVGNEAKAGLHAARDEANDAVESARHSVRSAARETADTAADLNDRAGDAAQSVRDRIRSSAADARERAGDAYDDVRSWASDRYDSQRARASDYADRGYRRLHEGRTAAEDFVSDNPLLVGVVGLAAGLLLGALLPRTQRESEALGPYADDLRDQGLRYARDVTRQGRAFVERALDPDNLDAAVEEAESRAGRPRDGSEEHREPTSGGGYEGAERTAHRL